MNLTLAKLQRKFYNLIRRDEKLLYLLYTFTRSCYKIHFVGGCVRDALMGLEPHDIDLVTDATPDEIIAMFPDKKVECRGASFLVAVVDGFEIATYRKDICNTGKASECEVERVKTLGEDLARRDFTCNAIAFNPIMGVLIDSFFGVGDIEDKIIKFVGNPEERIKEDHERILRACRFVSSMDGFLETYTMEALRENAHLVERIPKERMQLEIVKAMATQKASKFFDTLRHIGALKYLFPSLEACYDQDGGPHHAETIFLHCMEVGDALSTKNWRLKLAGYLHDVGKPPCAEISAETMRLRFRDHPVKGAKLVTEELTNLKFSNKTVAYISNLVLLHMTSLQQDFSKKAVKRFMVKLEQKKVPYQDWMRLLIADRKGNYKSKNFSYKDIRDRLRKIHELFKEEKMFSLKDLAVNGVDVMDFGKIGPCSIVGEVLNLLFEDCLENPEHNNREYLLKKIPELVDLF